MHFQEYIQGIKRPKVLIECNSLPWNQKVVLEAAALREKFCSYFLTNSGELVLSLQSLPYRVSSSINASFSRANNCKRLIVETEKDKQQ